MVWWFLFPSFFWYIWKQKATYSGWLYDKIWRTSLELNVCTCTWFFLNENASIVMTCLFRRRIQSSKQPYIHPEGQNHIVTCTLESSNITLLTGSARWETEFAHAWVVHFQHKHCFKSKMRKILKSVSPTSGLPLHCADASMCEPCRRNHPTFMILDCAHTNFSRPLYVYAERLSFKTPSKPQ